MSARSTVAVMPVYDPGEGLHERVADLRRQVAAVVVVDDGSRKPVGQLNGIPGVVLQTQGNAGIAAALNAGIRRARTEVPDLGYVLTVDQDSELGADYVAASIRAMTAARAHGLDVVATAADQYNDRRAAADGRVSGLRTALQVAQSGMLFSMEGLDRIGLFDESLVIDAVETDWVLRARRRGGLVVLADGASMLHPVGDPMPITIGGRPVRIGGRTRSYSHHSPLRRYYITRNRLLVYPRFTQVALRWLVRDTLAESKTLAVSLVLGPGRSKQALGTAIGIVHGALGVRGKAAPSLQRTLSDRR
ncbi:rhamnosyltransferase [Curtobacterium sp. 9128]|uniref:glycosyltransferase n=1 Tax=Curtobacterium sp. 9128 TaxID=1793722 RepID=UPI0007D7199C|nr:glycosyltransferase [Curtobacterium sp. 9128]SBN62273.1 rhamnosyltransferase [Curtobacterium sp. 9128]